MQSKRVVVKRDRSDRASNEKLNDQLSVAFGTCRWRQGRSLIVMHIGDQNHLRPIHAAADQGREPVSSGVI